MKIRINDLARELEVKSKAILDALAAAGVTEKKTHSSSLEADEAERVRQQLAKQRGPSRDESRTSRSPEAFKPKIDLSKISRPGDVLKAISRQTEPEPKPSNAPPVPAIAIKAPGIRPIAIKAPVAATPVAPSAGAAAAPGIAEGSVPAAPVGQASAAVSSPVATASSAVTVAAAAPSVSAAGATVATTPPATSPATSATPVSAAAPGSAAVTDAPAEAAANPLRNGRQEASTSTAASPRRLITPQTGPRPVYLAPPAAPPRPGMPIANRPLRPAAAPGALDASGVRPAPGLPQRGKPIFQRPVRPAMPGSTSPRPPMAGRPGEVRRGPHPTSRPTGMAGAPGMAPPPSRPAGRPGPPSRRPGQRYVPRGVKEGPMKGLNAPSRVMASSEPLPITRKITITEGISMKDLAEKLEIRAKDLIARLLARGVFATINQTLDAELANEMARHFGAETDIITFEDQAAQQAAESADAGAPADAVTESDVATGSVPRPPVVTIMGHVDHGKTSLLDAIRETNVAGGEAGGITQHIGAYKVKITKADSPAFGREIVFLDTPGHEAFTRMRARGAKVTDIVVLVVAADDGVMPQTIEAIDHALAAKVPIIVAVNKIDKPDALPERVKKQLADRGLMPEDWGGSTVFVDVSAKQHTNLNLLMEMICLVADLGDLRATPERPATGSVLEAKLDRGRGVVATVLVQNGTLRTGDTFIVGNSYGRVRAMVDDRGRTVDTAPPSTPVEVTGLESLPQAGDQLSAMADREKAKQISQYREQKFREATLAKSSKLSLEGLAEKIKTAGVKELPLIIKGDVQGSVEVLADSLGKLGTDKVKTKILHTGVGAVNETDVLLASASNAIIIGFNVRPERKAQELAQQEDVEIRLHSIIYELQDEIKKAMTGLLEPTIKETYMGRAEVRDTFRVPKAGTIAGCYVQDGVIKRDAQLRLVRDNVVIFTGKVASLRRFKDDASEVRSNTECGIGIANYGDVKVGDVIEAYSSESVAAEAIL